VQDAIAAANILVPELLAGRPTLDALRRVEARRAPPVRKMQRLQVFLQDRVLSPAIEGRAAATPPWFLRMFRMVPVLRRIPAHIIGIGFLPEHVNTREESRR
jgi:hypothetical protein